MIVAWILACDGEAPRAGLEPTPTLPAPCASLTLPPPTSPTTLRHGSGVSAGTGWVRRADGTLVPLPGEPLDLEVADDGQATVALGWLGAFVVDAEGSRRVPLEGEVVAVDSSAGSTWFADRRGRVVEIGPSGAAVSVEVAGWPVDLLADARGVWIAAGAGGLLRLERGAAEPARVDGAERSAFTPRGGDPRRVDPAPVPIPRPSGGATIGPAGELGRAGQTGSALVPVATGAEHSHVAGEWVVAHHGRDGSMSFVDPLGLVRLLQLDGAAAGAVRPAGPGEVWVPLPWVGAQRVEVATGATRTTRFAPGARDVLDLGERGALAARGDFGIARILPHGGAELCHPGVPVHGFAVADDGAIYVVVAGALLALGDPDWCCRPRDR